MHTPLDELVDFKYKIVSVLEDSQDIVSLLLDCQNIDMNDDRVNDIDDTNIFDHYYLDYTVQQTGCFIFVETEMSKRVTGTIKDMTVRIYVLCSKDYMKLTKFKGMKGNRRDNVMRLVSDKLDGSKDFGIGRLTLESCSFVSVPNPYTAMVASFSVSNYA